MNVEELEAHLREVIARVRAGEVIHVLDGGRPAVELSPCADEGWRVGLGITPALKQARDVHVHPVPVAPGFDPVAMLIEDREDRDLFS
jgi:antitoxin (DNA-binding transcriptional repressor) of toxin-antitoxin stability system